VGWSVELPGTGSTKKIGLKSQLLTGSAGLLHKQVCRVNWSTVQLVYNVSYSVHTYVSYPTYTCQLFLIHMSAVLNTYRQIR
jgi:hypothetical protein